MTARPARARRQRRLLVAEVPADRRLERAHRRRRAGLARSASASRHRHETDGRRHEAELDCPDHGAAFAARPRGARGARPVGSTTTTSWRSGTGSCTAADRFTEPVVVDDDVVAALRTLVAARPAAQPGQRRGDRARRRPRSPTSRTSPSSTPRSTTRCRRRRYTYAVPRCLARRAPRPPLRLPRHLARVVSRRTAALLGREPSRTCGWSCSTSATAPARAPSTVVGASTPRWGLSPLEGLVMGTRSGDVDPALARLPGTGGWAVRGGDTTARSTARAGCSGCPGSRLPRRDGAARGRRRRGRARLRRLLHRIRKYVGAYAAVLGRLDALVFTGGIGERSPVVRAAVVDGLGVLGLRLDVAANAEGPAERLVSSEAVVGAGVGRAHRRGARDRSGHVVRGRGGQRALSAAPGGGLAAASASNPVVHRGGWRGWLSTGGRWLGRGCRWTCVRLVHGWGCGGGAGRGPGFRCAGSVRLCGPDAVGVRGAGVGAGAGPVAVVDGFRAWLGGCGCGRAVGSGAGGPGRGAGAGEGGGVGGSGAGDGCGCGVRGRWWRRGTWPGRWGRWWRWRGGSRRRWGTGSWGWRGRWCTRCRTRWRP